MISRLVILPAIFLLLISCAGRKEEPARVPVPGRNEMADLNRYLIMKDRERIENFIERKHLRMEETSSGLWYHIRKEGEGSLLTDNDRVIFDYECTLLDGTFCYSSEDKGPRDVILGRSELEAGLNEGLRLLRNGGEAIFIIPPYLAYGIPGDGNKIPSRAVLVYEIKIISVIR